MKIGTNRFALKTNYERTEKTGVPRTLTRQTVSPTVPRLSDPADVLRSTPGRKAIPPFQSNDG